MWKFGFCCAALVLILLPAGPLYANQMLVNPGFETSLLTPWAIGSNFGASEDWNVTPEIVHSGAFSVTNVGNEELVQTFPGVPVSSITQVSFWVEHPDVNVTALAYHFVYSDSSVVENMVFTSDTGWDFFDVTAQLTAGKDLVGLSVFGNSGGRTYLDDVSIITAGAATPEPNSLLLLAAGALGLCVRLRSRRSGFPGTRIR